MARVPCTARGGHGIVQAEGVIIHTEAEAGENLSCRVHYGGSNMTEAQFYKLQRVLEMDGGDHCTML